MKWLKKSADESGEQTGTKKEREPSGRVSRIKAH